MGGVERSLYHAKWIQVLSRLFPNDPMGSLERLVSAQRQKKIDAVVAQRTVTIVPVLEKFYDTGNISAVLRSSEALGYQQVHVIKNPGNLKQQGRLKQSRRVTQGADKWLDVISWEATTDCLQHLKKRGYRIAVTHLEASVPLTELRLDVPTAIVFGGELKGASEEALRLADVRCHIPMRGFTQSFNVSVAAGIVLYEIARLRDQLPSGHGDLKAEQQNLLRRYYWFLSTTFKRGTPKSSGIPAVAADENATLC